MDQQQLNQLFTRYIQHTASAAEARAFFDAIEQMENRSGLEQMLDAHFANAGNQYGVSDNRGKELLQTIYAAIENKQVANKKRTASIHSIVWWRRTPVRYAAAVIVLLIAGVTIWNKKGKDDSAQLSQVTKDVPPASNNAILTLADGSTISLDNIANGLLAKQQGVMINKKDGVISYEGETANAKTVSYNTLTTPNGGLYQLTLPDGSRVWLNAASSIKFPTAFTGKERRVEVSGELYFEIEKNSKKPFKVLADGQEIEVLGTSFNVNLYKDEPSLKTTLITGAVRVLGNNKNVTLKPGQELAYNPQTAQMQVSAADVETTLSWKNNVFKFTNANIYTLMREVARWYDLTVEYQGTIKETFNGTIPRNLSAATLFKVLSTTDGATFIIENKKVIVKP